MIVLYNNYIGVVKAKVMISFAVTAKLICAFVFAYADCWFSHAAAHMLYEIKFCSLAYVTGAEIECGPPVTRTLGLSLTVRALYH